MNGSNTCARGGGLGWTWHCSLAPPRIWRQREGERQREGGREEEGNEIKVSLALGVVHFLAGEGAKRDEGERDTLNTIVAAVYHSSPSPAAAGRR